MAEKCDHCGEDIPDGEECWDGLAGTVCGYCEHDVTRECGLCGETFAECHSGLVVMLMPSEDSMTRDDEPDDGAALRSGVYLVTRWPYQYSPMVGQGSVAHDSLRRLADVPAAALAVDWSTIGQHVCLDCAEPYVLDVAKPIQRCAYGWNAGGRVFVGRGAAVRYRDAWATKHLLGRMGQMLERLAMAWQPDKRPEFGRRGKKRQRRWLKNYRRIYGDGQQAKGGE